jgi:MoxR-like ATPase
MIRFSAKQHGQQIRQRVAATFRISFSSSANNRVRIGHVDIALGDATSDRHLIPSDYLPTNPSPTFIRHLQWMMAKDNLCQDMMLVGPPGAGACYRRRLALSYAELTRKQVEVLTLSSDLTESDLKQRRELVEAADGQTAVQFMDQAPVRAAKHGRLLVLDGLEKAERNVLPTLNNLLENREMHLEDGYV